MLAAGAEKVPTGVPGALPVRGEEDLDGVLAGADPRHLHLAAFHPSGTRRFPTVHGRHIRPLGGPTACAGGGCLHPASPRSRVVGAVARRRPRRNRVSPPERSRPLAPLFLGALLNCSTRRQSGGPQWVAQRLEYVGAVGTNMWGLARSRGAPNKAARGVRRACDHARGAGRVLGRLARTCEPPGWGGGLRGSGRSPVRRLVVPWYL